MAPRSLALSLLAATLIPVLTLAAEPGSAAPANSRPELNARQRELLAKFDRNHDGRIDDEEKLAARAYMRGATDGGGERKERRKQQLKLFDKNGDGALDDAERAEAAKAREEFQANRAAILKRFDRDGDGMLNEQERAAAIQAREGQKRGPK